MLSMKQHQKCFSLKHPRSGKLANKFLLVTNLQARDGGKEIIAGNEKVIRARLSDAKFFWEQDLKKPLDEMAVALGGITFHEKLGSQKERVERVAELAFQIAGAVDAEPGGCAARGAARQGRPGVGHGRRVPRAAGADGALLRGGRARPSPRSRAPSSCTTSRRGRPTRCRRRPTATRWRSPWRWPTSSTRWWASGRSARSRRGSGDPYQLRRAALGVIRIVLENDLRVAALCAQLRPISQDHGLAPIERAEAQ